MTSVLHLHGAIHLADGQYVSRCFELDTCTAGDSLEQVLDNTTDMIRLYFATCAQKGVLDRELTRLAAGGPPMRATGTLDVEMDLALPGGERRVIDRQHIDLLRAA